MKEIKFRIFLKDTGRYINEGVDIGMLSLPKNWETYFILEQYTGLTDKNGVEIYEGDILKNITIARGMIKLSGEYINPPIITESVDTVIFDNHWCSFKFTKRTERGELEIIGNIHEQ